MGEKTVKEVWPGGEESQDDGREPEKKASINKWLLGQVHIIILQEFRIKYYVLSIRYGREGLRYKKTPLARCVWCL